MLVLLINDVQYEVEISISRSPMTIQSVLDHLPIHARAIKIGKKISFQLPATINIKSEGKFSKFTAGEIGVNTSSKNLTIYLEDMPNVNRDTYFGKIKGDSSALHNLGLSSSIALKGE